MPAVNTINDYIIYYIYMCMSKIIRLIIDIIFIIYILIIPMWIIELLNIDLIKIHESIFE